MADLLVEAGGYAQRAHQRWFSAGVFTRCLSVELDKGVARRLGHCRASGRQDR